MIETLQIFTCSGTCTFRTLPAFYNWFASQARACLQPPELHALEAPYDKQLMSSFYGFPDPTRFQETTLANVNLSDFFITMMFSDQGEALQANPTTLSTLPYHKILVYLHPMKWYIHTPAMCLYRNIHLIHSCGVPSVLLCIFQCWSLIYFIAWLLLGVRLQESSLKDPCC